MKVKSGRTARFVRIAPLSMALAFAGCQRQGITVYQVPKETNQTLVENVGPGEMRPGAESRPEIRWSHLPAGWKEGQPTSMRVATFVITGPAAEKAELSVTPLRGASDIESGSVNMWRNELGLAPVGAAEGGEKIQVGDATGTLYNLAGQNGEGEKSRILGAVLQREGVAWFFKMRGSDSWVAQQKPAFTEFLKDISFVDASGPVVAAHAGTATPGPAAMAGTPAKPQWEVPAHWQEQPPKTMLLAAFAVTGAGGQAEVTVSAFPGDVGGLSANVNRWRRQIGLGPVGETEIARFTSPVDVNKEAGVLVDMTNETTGNTIAAVLLPHAGMTWFFKLSGPDAVVRKEKPAFIKFVQSVRFPTNA